MSVVEGVLPAVLDASELTLAHPWIWWRAADLQPGWMVQLGDGRWAEVVTAPVLGALGKVTADVSWQGQPPEAASWPWRRLLKVRPPLWEAAYVERVWEHASANAWLDEKVGRTDGY